VLTVDTRKWRVSAVKHEFIVP